MDLIDLIDDFELIEALEDEEAYERAARMRRPRVLKARVNYLEVLNDVDFKSRFRLTKNAVRVIHDQIKDKISQRTTRNNAVPTIVQLLLTLRYFATGSYLMSAGDIVGVSSSSACRFIKGCSEAIAELRPKYVRFPEDLAPLKQGFYKLARFPSVIGAIACTHVAMSPNGENAEVYRNRKGVLSVNVQVVCDANLIIRDIVARWPGSTHNETIFDNSLIKARFEAGQFKNCILLGDSGYQSMTYLFTPLAQTNNPGENLYNESHMCTRNTVERCIGVLKSRFPVLRRRITLSMQRTAAIVVACAVLHNVAVGMNDEPFQLEIEEEPDEIEEQIIENDDDVAYGPRRQLILDYFIPMLEDDGDLHNQNT